jgi:hypothetical protein
MHRGARGSFRWRHTLYLGYLACLQCCLLAVACDRPDATSASLLSSELPIRLLLLPSTLVIYLSGLFCRRCKGECFCAKVKMFASSSVSLPHIYTTRASIYCRVDWKGSLHTSRRKQTDPFRSSHALFLLSLSSQSLCRASASSRISTIEHWSKIHCFK